MDASSFFTHVLSSSPKLLFIYHSSATLDSYTPIDFSIGASILGEPSKTVIKATTVWQIHWFFHT